MKKKDKTNVMRLLDQAGITYTSHFCEEAEGLSGEEIAKVMGENPDQTFKTLVTVCAKTKEHFVFVVPVNKELNLMKKDKLILGMAFANVLPHNEYNY